MGKKNQPRGAENKRHAGNKPVVRSGLPIIRRSYYGFSKRFPGNASNGTYLIGDSLKVKRRESVKKALFALLLLLLFAAAYVFASTALFIAEG